MVRKILAIISLVGLITIGLLVYSSVTSVSEMEQSATGYKQGVKSQLVAKAKEIAGPTLEKFGVDVEEVEVNSLNIVQQKLEDASAAVGEATKKITGSQ